MIYIIIPVFNEKKFIRPCLDSLLDQSYRKFKIVLVDAGSTDGSYDMVSSLYPDIHIIKGTPDWWWATSMNAGVKYALKEGAEGDYILSLNIDLRLENTYLQSLYEYSQHYPRSVIGSVNVSESNSEQVLFSGVRWSSWSASYKSQHSIMANGGAFSYLDTDLLPGRGTLFPLNTFKEAGLYDDERFPQYAADEELSLRAKNKGFALMVNPNAITISNTENTGNNLDNADNLTLAYFLKCLVSRKSPFYLKARFYFALKHGTIPPIYFIFDLMRCTGSFLRSYFYAKVSDFSN